jgi:hypothetical protein
MGAATTHHRGAPATTPTASAAAARVHGPQAQIPHTLASKYLSGPCWNAVVAHALGFRAYAYPAAADGSAACTGTGTGARSDAGEEDHAQVGVREGWLAVIVWSVEVASMVILEHGMS